MNDPQPKQPSRVDALRALMAGVEAGLPAPLSIRFHDSHLYVELDSAAHIDFWAAVLRLNGDGAYGRSGQPHPLDVPPSEYELWLTSVYQSDWHGWVLCVKADDPITDEQRRDWVFSGRAAQRAAFLAEKAGEQA